MEISILLIGFLLGCATIALLWVIVSNKTEEPKEPYCEAFSYDDKKVTHIVSYEEAEPDKYIVVTTNGSYRVPENFMIYHSGELLYVEEIATGNRNYANTVYFHNNTIKDLTEQK